MKEEDIDKILEEGDKFIESIRAQQAESKKLIAQVNAATRRGASDAEFQRAKQAVEERRRRGFGLSVTPPLVEKPQEPEMSDEEIDALLAKGDDLVEQLHKSMASQKRILAELEATPLEKECDAARAEMGQKLHRLEQDTLQRAHEANAERQYIQRATAGEEELEKSGKPPPLYRVK